jgi:hypothetical protein
MAGNGEESGSSTPPQGRHYARIKDSRVAARHADARINTGHLGFLKDAIPPITEIISSTGVAIQMTDKSLMPTWQEAPHIIAAPSRPKPDNGTNASTEVITIIMDSTMMTEPNQVGPPTSL